MLNRTTSELYSETDATNFNAELREKMNYYIKNRLLSSAVLRLSEC